MGTIVIPASGYPNKLDTDYNLFWVANTAETPLAQDLEVWATTIYITPHEDRELWGDNGFVNIAGELIYYDGALKQYGTGRVYALINCIRNVGPANNNFELARKPRFYPAGTMIRGFVVAEHHNKHTEAIANVERFIGIDNSEDKSTLDWLVNYMKSIELVGDDAFCPQVTFYFTKITEDTLTGTTIRYNLSIAGSFDTFTIDFGDGTTESNELIGTHTYAPNQVIDPIVTVTSQLCDIVQTVPERDVPSEPLRSTTSTGPDFPLVPNIPEFPQFDLSVVNDVPNTFQFPPIVFPCLDIGPFGPIVIPSEINVVQSNVIPSLITFGDAPAIPSVITFSSDVVIPSLITISAISNITVSVDVNLPPLDLFLNSNYCVNCTDFAEATVGQTAEAITGTGCDACSPGTTALVTRVQVVLHDFLVTSVDPDTGVRLPGRYDYVKILIVSPDGTTALIMGGAEDEVIGPSFDMTNPVTITFDDTSSNNIYDYSKKLVSGTYKPNANNNILAKSSGTVILGSKAPFPGASGYGSSLSVFVDKKVPLEKWKVYIAVGPKSGGPDTVAEVEKVCIRLYYNELPDKDCPTPTPKPSGATPARTPKPTFRATPAPTPKPIIPPQPPPIVVYPQPEPPPVPLCTDGQCGACLFFYVEPYGWCFALQTCTGPCACLSVPQYADPSVGVAWECCQTGNWPAYPPGGPIIGNPPSGGTEWPPNYCVKTKNDANQTCVGFTDGNKDPYWTIVSGPYQDYNACIKVCNAQDPPDPPKPEPVCGTCEYKPIISPCNKGNKDQTCSYRWDKKKEQYVFVKKEDACGTNDLYTNCQCLSGKVLTDFGYLPKEFDVTEFKFRPCFSFSWDIVQTNCTQTYCNCPKYAQPPNLGNVNIIANCQNTCGNCEFIPKTTACGVKVPNENECIYTFDAAVKKWTLTGNKVKDADCKCRSIEYLTRKDILAAQEKAGTYSEAPHKMTGEWEKISDCVNQLCSKCDNPPKAPANMDQFDRTTCYNAKPKPVACGSCYHMTDVKPCSKGGKVPARIDWFIGDGCPCKYTFNGSDKKGISNIWSGPIRNQSQCLCPDGECLTVSKLWALGVLSGVKGLNVGDSFCIDCAVINNGGVWIKPTFNNGQAEANCIDPDAIGVPYYDDPSLLPISYNCNCPDIPPDIKDGSAISIELKNCQQPADKCGGYCVYELSETDENGNACAGTCWRLIANTCRPPDDKSQCTDCVPWIKKLAIDVGKFLYQECVLRQVAGFAGTVEPSYFVSNKKELPLWETPSIAEKITRPKLCSYASREPLAMIKQGCGSCAVRKCEIFGMCSHTHSLPQMPEVHCCQLCPRYSTEKNADVVISTASTISTSEVNAKVTDNPYAKTIKQHTVVNEANQIPVIDHNQIVQDSLQDENKIIILPKNSNIKISIKELLGQEDEPNSNN